MRLKQLALLLAAAGACAALPALSQDRYYPNDSRYYPNDSRYYPNDSRPYDSRIEQGRDYRDDGRYRDDVAQVIDVNPVGGQREECWNPRANQYEEVRGPDKAKIVSKDTAIGAVAGGVIGHQIDSGAVGTVGGALLGGLAGHAYEQHQNNQETQDDLDRSRCRVVSNGEARDYDVRYRYRGREWVARMDHPPGDTLVPGRDIKEDGLPYHSP
ncbi:MAG TPA: glycine zipper 2TM domain-containing protein [Usitatibacter sp.]|jgi:uncharacterized protein YcfJ|nr:glycine zipper 2TM domain-containing protein [Usitatibacter sp.]